jgi:SAM-dependent methyltransferase
MDGWSSGYVTDISYTHGVYRELTPAILNFVALVNGICAPDPDEPLAYCELGCGQGYSTNLFAAANPHIQFYANDFNPSHVFSARNLAAAAGMTNVHFSDSSFEEFRSEPGLPQFDMICLHGIYSWISPENRKHIVDFIRTKLKPGGLVYISYNCLPGWALRMPMRRLMADHAAKLTGPTAQRVEQALAYVQRLVDVDSRYFMTVSGLTDAFNQITQQSRNYLAHEYFNRDLNPLYHADVADELSEAKLSFVGSAALLDNLDVVNFTTEQQNFLQSIDDRTERETLRDFLLNQQFRRDVFIKGAVPLTPDESRTRWLKTRFVLSTLRETVPLKVTGALGEAELQEAVYQPILDGLADGARTVEQLLEDPKVAEVGWDRMLQAFLVLVGSGHLQPALNPVADADRAASTKSFNLAVMNKARSTDDLQCLASPLTGGSISLDRFSRLFQLAKETGHDDVPIFTWDLLKDSGVKLQRNDETLESDAENLEELRRIFASFNERLLPVLKMLAIA